MFPARASSSAVSRPLPTQRHLSRTTPYRNQLLKATVCPRHVQCRASGVSRAELARQVDTGDPSDSGNDSGGNDNGNGNGKSVGEEPNDYDYNGWNPFKRIGCGIAGRAAADPDFWYKICVECGIDAVIIAGVNYGARGDSFFNELEFVLCQILVSCSNDFVLVALLAPTLASPAIATNRVARYIAALPPHIFCSGLYSLRQRLACFCYKAVQCGEIGFAMGLLGAGTVNSLTNFRELADESFEPPSEAPSALLTGCGWLYFMGLNSNFRYNGVAWAEQVLYRQYPGALSKIGSIILRLVNNFVGAYQYVDLADEIGVSQPRKSLREERRHRERLERRGRWLWWRRREPEPKKWPFCLFQAPASS